MKDLSLSQRTNQAKVIQHGVFVTLTVCITGALTYARIVDPRWYIALVLVMGGWVPLSLLIQLLQTYQRGLLGTWMPPPPAPPSGGSHGGPGAPSRGSVPSANDAPAGDPLRRASIPEGISFPPPFTLALSSAMSLIVRTLVLHRLQLLGVLVTTAMVSCQPLLPPVDGCAPSATRCSPEGRPEVCSPSRRWAPADTPCATRGATCCTARSPYGRLVSACVRAERCEPAREVGGA